MSKTGDLLRKGWSKVAFVPGPAGGAPADPAMAGGGGAPPMDPSMGGMAGAMDPAMAGGGGGMPPAGGAPVDPAMMGAPPMDPAAAGGAPPIDPAMMGIPPGPEAAGEEAGGETMLPMSEVVELLGAVTGKRAPAPETPEPQEGLAAAAGEAAAETPPADPAAAAQTNPVTPLGGIDPSALG